MTAITDTLDRVGTYLGGRPTRPGILVRRLEGRPADDDAHLATVLCNERRATTRMDGAIGGSLLATAWAAWEMMDLGLDALHGGLSRLIHWVQGAIEGTQQATDVPPITLPAGQTVAGADAAAFAARCLGLRVALRARDAQHRPAIAQQVAAVAAGTVADLPLTACALGVVALAPPPHYERLDAWVERVAAAQAADGTWPGADLFHVLDALVLAGSRAARQVIAAAAPALEALLRDDGAFDPPAHPAREERAWIGYRALRVAAEA